jgi:hypothetical protein
MALGLGDVRYWMNSGKHMLALSFSGFDPNPTFSDPRRSNKLRVLQGLVRSMIAG